MFGIFETPQGKMKIPLDELLDPFGVSYGEREEKKEQRRKPPEKPPEKKYFSR